MYKEFTYFMCYLFYVNTPLLGNPVDLQSIVFKNYYLIFFYYINLL